MFSTTVPVLSAELFAQFLEVDINRGMVDVLISLTYA